MKPRDFTVQENYIAEILTDLGLRYERQYSIGSRTVDFYLPEMKSVIEADGVYGHLRKADRKRDSELVSLGICDIYHVRDLTKPNILETLVGLFCQE